jgi:mycothiol synthase
MTDRQDVPVRVVVPDPPEIPGLSFRRATPDDWGPMAALVNASHRADGIDEVRSGEDLRAEYEPLDAFDVARDVVLAEVDGVLVGLAFGLLVHRDGALVAETWGSVEARYRRRAIGSAMWRANRDRLAAAAAEDPRPGPRELRTFALDTEDASRALIAAHGYVAIRHGFEMRRFLTGSLPAHRLPEGLELRPVRAADHRAIFEADNEAFEDHWGHRPQTEGDFVARFTGPEVDTGLWSVAWAGDEVAGVVMTAIFRAENEALGVRRGWLEHVSVRRRWRGLGVAKALCCDAFRVLREQGMTEAWLGVDASNPTGALGLYEGLGFGVARRWQAYARPIDRPAPAGWRAGSPAPAG